MVAAVALRLEAQRVLVDQIFDDLARTTRSIRRSSLANNTRPPLASASDSSVSFRSFTVEPRPSPTAISMASLSPTSLRTCSSVA